MADTNVATPSLPALLDAFNARDIDAIMAFSPTTASLTCPADPRPGADA